MGKQRRPITVAETKVFERAASNCMSQQERSDFTDFIAQHPLKGDRVRGTGGLRKVRWGPGNRGKSGGLRVLYYYMDDNSPLYLITVWDKSNKLSLSGNQKKKLKKLAKAIKHHCKGS
jgi:mRNA-degrading endonuclease RelE of RelBE toxin-antitoxin system